jgi:amino acid adenylation domain-containing protein
VVALLGVMKAGGAYVPMDPAWPAQRLGFTLLDCAAPVLLTQQRLSSSWTPVGAHVLCLDAEATLLASQPSHDPAPAATAGNLAYVIYTSGSTGTPKGVMVQHRSVLNLRHALARTVYAGQPGGLRVSVNAPLAFDASVKQLIQLLDGHCLCIVPEATRQDPAAMRQWVKQHRVDVLDCTPSLLRLLVQDGLLQDAAAPRLLVPGGEAIDEALWQQLAAAPRTRTVNVYGPTECTVDSTAFAVRPDTRPTIGGPLANVQVYVLDGHLRPVPVGVPGELFISGAGLARGYLGRPGLTAERFLPDAFSATPGARMYRTGDKVRWLADGTLDYLGRTDFQVKLRGFRIELGEIEAALAQHPSVRQALVLVREVSPGNPQLVAWLTSDEAAFDTAALRAFLKQRLPEYMVPSAFVPLDAFPLTPNGKVDRRALPAPDLSRATGPHELVAPRDVLEHTLVGIWRELLGLQSVGIRTSFFELGGHSLLAVQLMARIREHTGRELPLAALFQAPTVEGLASLLRQVPAPFSPLVPIQRDGSKRPLFLVHPVGGNVLGYAELARRLGPELPVYGLQSQGLDGQQPPLGTLEEQAALYLEVLRTVQPHGPYRLGGWSMGALVAFEMAHQLQAHGEEVELLALIDPSPATQGRVRVDTEDAAQVAAHFAMDLASLTVSGSELPAAPPSGQGVDAVLQYLLDLGREAGLLVPEVGLPQLRTLFEVFAGNLRALKHYVPRPLAARVMMLRASEGADASGQEDRGWAALVTGRFELRDVPGNHYSVLREPGVRVLADQLAALLEETTFIQRFSG